jgi:mycothiol synthase
LGQAVCAAVVARYARGGYQRVFLNTDDFRLPAVKVYLKLGFVPFLHGPDMEARWRKVCAQLQMPFEPARP